MQPSFNFVFIISLPALNSVKLTNNVFIFPAIKGDNITFFLASITDLKYHGPLKIEEKFTSLLQWVLNEYQDLLDAILAATIAATTAVTATATTALSTVEYADFLE